MKQNPVIFNIVNGWNVEAKMEDSKYFYLYKEVHAILNNRKCYVIGRKGTGKSAICKYITSIKEYNVFSTKLSFQSFPYNVIYGLEDSKYTHPNQYITIWKYIIYSHILKMMIKNQSVDPKVRAELEKIYPPSDAKQLSREVSEWTSVEFGAQVLGNGGSLKLDKNSKQRSSGWIDYVNVMEDIIREYSGNAKYYIVFDELDDDYKDITIDNKFQNYIELLTSLFKAVQDIRALFSKDSGFHIIPVIFLRDDVYAHIKDNDKNKWADLSITLDWNAEKLKALLAYRISMDDPMRPKNPSFEKEWNLLFTKDKIHTGFNKKKLLHTFDYMGNPPYERKVISI